MENLQNNKYRDKIITIIVKIIIKNCNHPFKILESSENFNFHKAKYILFFPGIMKE